jgi:hypothetical protein
MGYAYDNRFKIGFVATVAVFLLINVVSYFVARSEYEQLAKTNKLFPVGGNLPWGFPLHWSGSESSDFLATTFARPITNLLIILIAAVAAGIGYRWIRSFRTVK